MNKYILAILRLSMGWIFFWAFLDKLFGLGFSTPFDKAWLNGNSPTYGFLKFATYGPFASFYQNLAGNFIVDCLFMLGLFLIGLSLILGIGVKIAGYTGALMTFLIWTALLPPKHNPLLDEHLIYLLVLIYLAHSHSGKFLGLGGYWSKTKLVQKFKFLE